MSESDLEFRFYEIVDSVLPLEDTQRNRDISLEELGMDELDLVEFVQECEDEFEVMVDSDTMENWKTLGDVFDFIVANQ